jgi:hypothetical protein
MTSLATGGFSAAIWSTIIMDSSLKFIPGPLLETSLPALSALQSPKLLNRNKPRIRALTRATKKNSSYNPKVETL